MKRNKIVITGVILLIIIAGLCILINKKVNRPEECLPLDGGYSKVINYNTNGGNRIESDSICITCTPEEIDLPTPVKSGYIFEGWYADKGLTKKVSGALNDVEGAKWVKDGCYTEKTTIYAKWNRKDNVKGR